MSFLIASLLKDWRNVYPQGKVDYKINFTTRAESVGKGVWVECLLDSSAMGLLDSSAMGLLDSSATQGLKIHLQIWYDRMVVDIHELANGEHHSEEFRLKKRNWLMKDRRGSGFGLLVELGRWIRCYGDLGEGTSYFSESDCNRKTSFFESEFTIGSWELEWNWEDYAMKNEYFDDRFSYDVAYENANEFDENERKEDIDLRVTVESPYEMWPTYLYTSFDMFVLIFWFRFPKVVKCHGRDRWACVSCYRATAKELWDLPEKVKDPFVGLCE